LGQAQELGFEIVYEPFNSTWSSSWSVAHVATTTIKCVAYHRASPSGASTYEYGELSQLGLESWVLQIATPTV